MVCGWGWEVAGFWIWFFEKALSILAVSSMTAEQNNALNRQEELLDELIRTIAACGSTALPGGYSGGRGCLGGRWLAGGGRLVDPTVCNFTNRTYSCEWVDCNLEVLCVELKQILSGHMVGVTRAAISVTVGSCNVGCRWKL